MKKFVFRTLTFVLLMSVVAPALACVSCNKPLEAAIFNEDFNTRLLYVLMPVPLILLAAALIHKKFNQHNYAGIEIKTGPPAAAGFLIGVGMGGFVDGIIFHQILQWHEFFSAFIPPLTLLNKQINNFWDGAFHVVAWLTTAAGIALLWRSFFKKTVVLSTKIFVGSIIGGWGVFNVFDAIVYHYFLQLHNIREVTSNPDFYNHAYTAFAALLLIVSFVLTKSGRSKITV